MANTFQTIDDPEYDSDGSDIDHPNDKTSKILALVYMLFWSSILALVLGCDLTDTKVLSVASCVMLLIVISSLYVIITNHSVTLVSSLLALSLCSIVVTSILNAHRYQRIIDICSDIT